MNKNIIIAICSVVGAVSIGFLGYVIGENDLLDGFSSRKDEVVLVTNGKKEVIKTNGENVTVRQTGSQVSTVPSPKNVGTSGVEKKADKFSLMQPKVKITKNQVKSVEYQTYNNGLFSMKIPKGWSVGTSKSDYTHYTFMAYNPQNPDYKIFFNMKTEGYPKNQQTKNIFARYYPTSPFGKLPIISPQTTDGFYRIYTQVFNMNQNILGFRVPVIRNFKPVQVLGRNATGGSIVRATYQNGAGKNVEGIFTATIKEFAAPPAVLLIVYNTVYFTAPEGELVNWTPILNNCLSSIRFSNTYINGYYKEQGQVVQNANAIQAICNQTSNIITSGWNARQKTYDILSQKRSDATMGYDRVRDTETGEIYKADLDFMDKDWHGRYEKISDDMYTLPTAGYIEKR